MFLSIHFRNKKGNSPRTDKEVSKQQSGESECLTEHLPVGNQPQSNESQTFFKEAPDKDLATKSKERQESTVETESLQVNDIEKLVTSVMTVAEIEDALHELSDNHRYHLLKHHSQPCKNYVFLSQFDGGSNRSFQIGWLEEFPWLVYSSALDGAFRITCPCLPILVLGWAFLLINHS